ncbi:FAD:protein FMN transferase [Gallaecimonas kandeliae]|uniref:FAD:protein FMN transferase n=1 Tax=Gallaecimonas kandeliae TaxID=3029055 RepID=UPI002648CED1|nr:FAD:protein FMN transferase [Gallaecimonas kandeliae]WKE64553.1 FAD:protein FMN transferase [Gallaecimonas kandeliae]
MRPLLGTFVELVVDQPLTLEQKSRAFVAGFSAIEEVQAQLSFHSPDSQLSRLNLNPGRWLALPGPSLRVLRLAKALTQKSGGLFNCTLGAPLVRRGILPDHGFGARLDQGDARALAFRPGEICLTQPVLISLDGIAKGYAVDRAVAAMKRAGVESGWVNAGGDIRAFGQALLPVTVRGEAAPRLLLSKSALASSSSQSDADFPGLLLDAKGQPLAPGQWTVQAKWAWRADALTKVAAQAPGLLERLGAQLLGPL